ncbi:MAG: 50S ribosomal protein L4 [Thermodesulfobacteria bacterium]|nr:50S ribosomal protein L4 [Thermodesulfobacteriota bacterium]
MATLAVYSAQKEKVGDIDVSDEVFGVEPKVGVLHEVVKWQLAKRRSGTASTKTRAEVSGGGRKPWRQKGTGRARVGSIRSPLWRHGGVAHGPKPRDYSYTLPKKVRKLALKMALSDKVASDRIFVIRDFGVDEIKTKKVAELLNSFGCQKAMMVTLDRDNKIELSARNIPGVKVLAEKGLNVYDLLKYEYLLIEEKAVQTLDERLRS